MAMPAQSIGLSIHGMFARWSAGSWRLSLFQIRPLSRSAGSGCVQRLTTTAVTMQIQKTIPVRFSDGIPKHNCRQNERGMVSAPAVNAADVRGAFPENAQQEHRRDAGREVAVDVEQIDEDRLVRLCDQYGRANGDNDNHDADDLSESHALPSRRRSVRCRADRSPCVAIVVQELTAPEMCDMTAAIRPAMTRPTMPAEACSGPEWGRPDRPFRDWEQQRSEESRARCR